MRAASTSKPTKCDHRNGVCIHSTEVTLTEALAAAGYTHRVPESGAPPGAREIVDASGAVVATLKAQEAWEWLRARERR